MAEQKLKDCPFCGGEAQIERVSEYPNYLIKCFACRTKTTWYADKNKLIKFWNTRVNTD